MAHAIAQVPVVRESYDGGVNFSRYWKGRCYERPLTGKLPLRPAAVPTYDWNTETGRLLVADFDVSLARQLNIPDPLGWVRDEARSFAALIRSLGGSCIVDCSPTGGYHVYVLFSRALPFEDLKAAAQALEVRYKSLDPKPMQNKFGFIAPPGAPHKLDKGTGRLTGWRTLVTPLEQAQRAAAFPNGAEVWSALVQELTAEAQQVRPTAQTTVAGTKPRPTDLQAVLEQLPHDDAGMPWQPLVGGHRPLAAELAAIAATGHFDGYGGDPSRARQAVLTAAAFRGWRYDQVLDQIRSGAWSGLAGLYARNPKPGRMTRLLPFEWQKAVAFCATAKPASNSDIKGRNPHPPPLPRSPAVLGESVGADGPSHGPVHCKDLGLGGPVSLTCYKFIRVWQNAVHVAEHDPAQRGAWGPKATLSVRAVLRALGRAAQSQGRIVIEHGCRSLAESTAGLSHEAVAKALKRLREDPDPFIVLEREHHLADADVYSLRIPDRYRDAAMWRRWRRGTFDAIHRVFHDMRPAAFLYEVLSTCEASAGELATAAALSDAATGKALKTMAALGLAERGDDGWRLGPVDLDTAAAHTGADTEAAQVHARHVDQRRDWHAWLEQIAQLRTAGRSWWQVPSDWNETGPVDPGPDYFPPELLQPPDDIGPPSLEEAVPGGLGDVDQDAALALLQQALGPVIILGKEESFAEALPRPP